MKLLELRTVLALALSVSLLGSCAASDPPPPSQIPYCGTPPLEDTPPIPPLNNSSFTLHHVLVLVRHGDRTIAGTSPCWNGDNAVWNCNLTDNSMPGANRSRAQVDLPRLHRKLYMPGRNFFPGNCMTGQLTYTGMEQERHNGKMYREYLVEKTGLLPAEFDPSKVFLRGDDEPRITQSVESVMLGLYPMDARSGSTEMVDIHTMDKYYDPMTVNTNLCPAWQTLKDEMVTSPEWLDHYKEFTAPLLDKMSSIFGYTLSVEDLDHVFDCLAAHMCHELEVPTSYELYQAVMEEANWQHFSAYTYPNRTANAQLGIGFLLEEIMVWLDAGVQEVEGYRPLVIFGCHDTTLMPVMAAYDVYAEAWVPYASHITFEVYSASSGDEFYVRMLFNENVLPLTGSDSNGLLSWSDFESMTSELLPVDPQTTCAV